MHKVVIMSGVSGSGKSSQIGKILEDINRMRSDFPVMHYVCSADHYFWNAELRRYDFDPSKLSAAHADCFRNFIDALCRHQNDVEDYIIFVDNTNTTVEEISPYILGASSFGFDAEVMTLLVRYEDLDKCAVRNSHGVGLRSIEAQSRRLANRHLPPWWNAKTIEVSF